MLKYIGVAIAAALAIAFVALPMFAFAATEPASAPAAQLTVLTAPAPYVAPTSAPAAGPSVVVPYGDWLADLAGWAAPILVAAGLFLLRKVPSGIVDILNQVAGVFFGQRVDQLLEKAIAYGVNATAGAEHGKTLSLAIGNTVLERAFEYATRNAPALVEMLGGALGLREKIIARIPYDAATAVPTPMPAASALVQSNASQAAPLQAPASTAAQPA